MMTCALFCRMEGGLLHRKRRVFISPQCPPPSCAARAGASESAMDGGSISEAYGFTRRAGWRNTVIWRHADLAPYAHAIAPDEMGHEIVD